MRIIISPAKKMKSDPDTLPWDGFPVFLDRSEKLKSWIQSLSLGDLRQLWNTSQKLAELNYERFQEMDLRSSLTPALLSYEGIQYQYMAAGVLEEEAYRYLEEHLRILSGFYGVLRPFDGVRPYRLEMQARINMEGVQNLYDFWGSSLYEEVSRGDPMILNLASKEYSKCIENYLKAGDKYITVVFGEVQNGRVIQKGTLAKMARGEMVRFLASGGIQDPMKIREFDGLGFRYDKNRSSDDEIVFIRQEKEEESV